MMIQNCSDSRLMKMLKKTQKASMDWCCQNLISIKSISDKYCLKALKNLSKNPFLPIIGILHIGTKVVYTFGDCGKSPFFSSVVKFLFRIACYRLQKTNSKIPFAGKCKLPNEGCPIIRSKDDKKLNKMFQKLLNICRLTHH